MAAFPFFHKKDSRLLLFIPLIFILSFVSIHPQTVIREKIGISPRTERHDTKITTNYYLDPSDSLCQTPSEQYLEPGFHNKPIRVLAGSRGNSDYYIWFNINANDWDILKEPEPPVYNVSVEGGDYAHILIHNREDNRYYESSENAFLLVNSIGFFMIFDKVQPIGKARVTVNYSYAHGTGQYLIDVYPTYFHLMQELEVTDLKHGEGRGIGVQALTQCYDWWPCPLESVFYTATIIKGQKYGSLYNWHTGEYDSSLVLTHFDGYLESLGFEANGKVPEHNEQIIIRIGMTDSLVEPIDITFNVKPDNLLVTFEPSIISPGDTANVILKEKNEDGTFSDISPNEIFDISIIDGIDFGTFFIPDWADTSDMAWGIPQGFKFIANQQIPGRSVESKILVQSAVALPQSQIPIDINPKKKIPIMNTPLKKFKKITSTMEGYISFRGCATVRISKNTSHVKASFDKENLTLGDTVNVIIKKVDAYGNESEYPAETLFEVGVIDGCPVGEILTSTGARGRFFPRIPQPVRFIVADTLSAADSVVALRVGAPDDESNSALVSTKPTGKSKKNISVTFAESKTQTNKRNLKITEGDYCATGNYTYGNVDFPIGKVGGGCEDKNNWCETNDPPKAPTVKLEGPYHNPNICNKEGYAFTNYNWDGKHFPTLPLRWPKYKLCFNQNADRWILTLTNENSTYNAFIFQYEQDYCYEKIIANWYAKYHENPVIIDNYKTLAIPSDPNEKELLRKDLEAHQTYPITPDRIRKYILKDFIVAHEDGHVDSLRTMINDIYIKGKYPEKYLNEFNYSCSKLNSKVKADNKAKEFLQKFEQQLLNEIANKYEVRFLGYINHIKDEGNKERLESIHNANVYDLFMKKIFIRCGFPFNKVIRWWL